jgi:cell envelope-related function transcriptional attenuator common domain
MTQNKNNSMARTPKRKPRLDNVTKGLLVAFAVVGILLAYFGGKFVFNLVKSWSLTSLPGAPVDTGQTTTTQATPTAGMQSNVGTTYKAWDGKSRVNILLLGLDTSSTSTSADRSGPPKSDTMILITIDPLSQTIGALSIRRDLLVNIPEGVGEKKINMAYAYGEGLNLPGGGPGLAMETVEQFLGVDINYYAQVDFDSFVKFIDDIGGITVTIDHEMTADWNNNGSPFPIEPGTYTLPGNYALAYARCREGCGDDFGRGADQMAMVMAVRDRIMKFNMLPKLIAEAPSLYNDVSAGIKTNMSLDQAIQLATLMVQIPRGNMKTYNIDTTEISAQTTAIIDGAAQQVLVANMEKIRLLRDEMFASQGSAAAPIALGNSDPLTLAKQENARIQILNGTGTTGLADSTSTCLQNKGLSIVGTSNTDNTLYTTITVSGATPYTVSYLASLMNVSENRIVNHYDPNAAADVIVTLGADWANSNSCQ